MIRKTDHAPPKNARDDALKHAYTFHVLLDSARVRRNEMSARLRHGQAARLDFAPIRTIAITHDAGQHSRFKCPLPVVSGHCRRFLRCRLYPRNQTSPLCAIGKHSIASSAKAIRTLPIVAVAYVRSKRGATNPHNTRTMIAPTIAPMKPAPSPA